MCSRKSEIRTRSATRCLYPKLWQAAAEISRAGVKLLSADASVDLLAQILYDCIKATRSDDTHALGLRRREAEIAKGSSPNHAAQFSLGDY